MFCGLFDYVSSNVPKILKSTHVKLIKFKRERFDNNVLANNKSIHITTASKLALFFAVFFFQSRPDFLLPDRNLHIHIPRQTIVHFKCCDMRAGKSYLNFFFAIQVLSLAALMSSTHKARLCLFSSLAQTSIQAASQPAIQLASA